TMPNSDTAGMVIRKVWDEVLSRDPRIFRIENFGTKGYFTCIKYCSFLLGNTSSGIIEAASFGKYVINLGRRQEGRTKSENVIDSSFDVASIKAAIKRIETSPASSTDNVYWKGGAVNRILNILKEQHQ
ncbi:MAG TPA: UDP-N-acetylglucosamine 2-epimerase, partial [Sphingobacteriaceae bacterium]